MADINQIAAGPRSSAPAGPRFAGSTLFFGASERGSGRELYRSFGTPSTTSLVRDIAAGTASSSPFGFAQIGGQTLFLARDASGVVGLWRTDGTARGTSLIAVVDTPTMMVGDPPFAGIYAFPGGLRGVFHVRGMNEHRSFATDGTAAGTVEIYRGSEPAGAGVALGADLWFAIGADFLATNGSVAGTRRVSLPNGRVLEPMVAFGNGLAFATQNGLAVLTISGSTPRVQQLYSGPMAWGVVANPSAVYGLASTGLVRSDGTSAGTVVVRSFQSVPGPAALQGNGVVFVADDGLTGAELWRSNGTAAGTLLLQDTTLGSSGTNYGDMVSLGARVVASAGNPQQGQELLVTDGTPAGTTLVSILPGADSSVPAEFAIDPSGGRAYFAATSLAEGRELWTTDGTVAGTRLFVDVDPVPSTTSSSSPDQFMVLNGAVLFAADDGAVGNELWRTDGTRAGTSLVRDIAPGSAGGMLFQAQQIGASHVVLNGTAYFVADDGQTGSELWRSDGTAAGTRLVADIELGVVGSWPHSFMALDETRFVFATLGVPGGLYVVDTASEVPQLLLAGPAHSTARLGDRVFFVAFTPATGQEPWLTDGTPAGTGVLDLVPGGGSSQPSGAVGFDGAVYFWSQGPRPGLWRTDGTVAGSSPVLDQINPRTPALHVANDRLYFAGYDGAHGEEPWVSDGTGAGTRLLLDVVPGGSGSAPGLFTGLRAGVVFSTNQGLWRTDGSAVSTHALAGGVWFGPKAVVSDRYLWMSSYVGVQRTDGNSVWTINNVYGVPRAVLGDQILGYGEDPINGAELWRLDLAATAVPVGVGCAGALPAPALRAADPVYGAVTTLQCSPARSGAVAAVVLGGVPAVPLAIGNGACALHVAGLAAVLPTIATPAGHVVDLRIPSSPALRGLRVAAQALVVPGTGSLGIDSSNGLLLAVGR